MKIFLLSLFFILVAAAEDIPPGDPVIKSGFYNYNSDNGLLFAQVMAITQGGGGEMYFFSVEGVTIYNGIDFRVSTSPFFNDGREVRNLITAEDGRILGMNGSKFIFSVPDWKIIDVRFGEKKLEKISSFLFIQGGVVILSSGEGIYKGYFHSEGNEMVLDEKIPLEIEFDRILKFRKGVGKTEVYGLDRRLGVFALKDDNSLLFSTEKSNGTDKIDFSVSGRYVVTLNRDKSLSVLRKNDLSTVRTIPLNSYGKFSRIEKIDDNSFWISSGNLGIFKLTLFNGGKEYFLRQYTERNGLSNNIVFDIFRDRNGIYWFATDDGISKLPAERFEKVVFDDIMGINGFPTSWREERGKIFLASNPYGILEIKKNNGFYQVHKISSEKLFRPAIFAAHKDKHNRLWLFTNKGIFTQRPAYSGAALKPYPYNSDISGTVWAAFPVSHSRILLGTYEEIILARPVSGKLKILDRFSLPEGRYETSAFCYTDDSHARVLAGGNRFLYNLSLKNDRIVISEDMKGGFNNSDFFVYALSRDRFGRIFIGTANDGLLVAEKGDINHSVEIKELTTRPIYALMTDSRDNIWAGSYNGLYRIKYNSGGKKEVTHFDISEMIPPVDINANSLFEDREGNIFFGLTNNAGIYYPDRDTLQVKNPSLKIAEVKIDNRPGTLINGTVLPFKFNNLSIKYYLPVYFSEKNLKYSYTVVPAFETWQKTLAPGQVLISALPPGDYVLKLRISDEKYLRDDVIKTIAFRVATPFWLSWWFYFILFIVFIIIAALIQKLRIRRIRRREQELERLVAERTGELSAKNLELAEKHRAMETLQRNKDEYFSIVTHDLKNPVNAIINLSRMMQMDYEDIPEELLNDIKIIESASTQMLNIVNNVNDFNKLQATEFKPRPVRMNVLQQVERIVAVYRLLAWPRGTEILLESSLSGAEEIIADPHSFEQIIGNILSNAVKFSPRNSRIRVLLRQEEGDVLISVLDQGEGIPRNILERISKQEEIPEDNDKYKVTGGLGLFIIRKLTNLLNGNLAFEVNSENGKETVVTVSFSLFTPDSEEEKTDD